MSATRWIGRASVESVVKQLRVATRPFLFEYIWIAGLRECRTPEDRAEILVAAGSRLRAFGEVQDDRARCRWLEQVAAEVRYGRDASLGQRLVAIATAELGEAFSRAKPDIEDLREFVLGGNDIGDFSLRAGLSASRVGELGRIVLDLKGNELMALVDSEDAKLVSDYAATLGTGMYLVPTVPTPLRVNREQLLQWAQTTQAPSKLPRLIDRLIRETEPSADTDFPGGTGVAGPGFDGVVTCSYGNQFVPAGRSGWELSTQQNGAHGKARTDYAKRVLGNSEHERNGMVYVAAICAPWTKSREFQDQYSVTGDFRWVRALNVDSLEAWLECAPVTTTWFREQIGAPVAGARLLSQRWEQWLASTRIPLDAGVVLAGRSEQARELRDRCRQQRGGAITVGGDLHAEEILAFVSAALVATARNGDVLYVDDHTTARQLLDSEGLSRRGRSLRSPAGMTIVVPSPDFAKHLPADSDHKLIVPLPGNSRTDVVVTPVDTVGVSKHLQAAGADECVAGEHAALARMSLLTLRRRLAVKPELHQPAWAAAGIERTLRRCLLLNSWNLDSDADRQLVKEFTGRPHDDVTEMLHEHSPGDEPPLVLTSERWHVPAPTDAWVLVGDQLTREDLDEFGDIVIKVLAEPDPLNDVRGLERVQAQSDGVTRRFSADIRGGVATTLALLGSFPPRPGLKGVAAVEPSAVIVAELLAVANQDPRPRTWNSVSEALPLLVEAAPDEVLDALRICLTGRHAFATNMFPDSEVDEFFIPPPYAHVSVVEALALLAWSPDHFAQTVDLLARMAAENGGGTSSSRPDRFLSWILSPWLPQTSADAKSRLQVLDMLRKHHAQVAWNLMLSMLPNPASRVLKRRGPRYRDWKRGATIPSPDEHAQMVAEVAMRLVDDARANVTRLIKLLEGISDLPPAARVALGAAVEEFADSGPGSDEGNMLWHAVRKMVSLHLARAKNPRALPESELVPFDGVLKKLQPSLPLDTYGWLFAAREPNIGGICPRDRDAYIETRAARQAGAIEAILRDGDLQGVIDFAAAVEQPQQVGNVLARTVPSCEEVNGSSLDKRMLGAMVEASDAVIQAALTYFAHRFEEFGWDGIDRLIAAHAPSARVRADVLRAIPVEEQPWQSVNGLVGPEAAVAREYWSRVDFFSLRELTDLAPLLEVSAALREAGRTGFAARLLALESHKHQSQLSFAEEVAACLEHLSNGEDSHRPDQGKLSPEEVGDLMRVLDDHHDLLGVERVAKIEWEYYQKVGPDYGFGAPNLYRQMAQCPDFFASFAGLAVRRSSGSRQDSHEFDRAKWHQEVMAYGLLHSWPSLRVSPGLDEQGKVDEVLLNKWVDCARTRLVESDLRDFGDGVIGVALVASPPDSDGVWPDVAVRDLIERLESTPLDTDIRRALWNKHSVTFRSSDHGGIREHELAGQFREASRRCAAWPRTASILSRVAEAFALDAEVHDREAEAHRRGLRR